MCNSLRQHAFQTGAKKLRTLPGEGGSPWYHPNSNENNSVATIERGLKSKYVDIFIIDAKGVTEDGAAVLYDPYSLYTELTGLPKVPAGVTISMAGEVVPTGYDYAANGGLSPKAGLMFASAASQTYPYSKIRLSSNTSDVLDAQVKIFQSPMNTSGTCGEDETFSESEGAYVSDYHSRRNYMEHTFNTPKGITHQHGIVVPFKAGEEITVTLTKSAVFG